MLCPNCGKEVDDGTRFCPYCGRCIDTTGASETQRKPPITPWGKPVLGKKSVSVGVILSLLITGLGTFYGGRGLRALGLFLGGLAISVVDIFALLATISFSGWFYIVVLACACLSPIYVIYSIYDAYKTCKINNQLWAEYLGY